MRYHEIASGFRVHVSSEEQNLINLIGSKIVSSEQLSEHDHNLAQLMVSRGLLDRTDDQNDTYFFTVSSVNNIWSDWRD